MVLAVQIFSFIRNGPTKTVLGISGTIALPRPDQLEQGCSQ